MTEQKKIATAEFSADNHLEYWQKQQIRSFLDDTTQPVLRVIVERAQPADTTALPSDERAGTFNERARNALNFLLRGRFSISYNDSYCGEPAGALKAAVAELQRLGAKPVDTQTNEPSEQEWKRRALRAEERLKTALEEHCAATKIMGDLLGRA